MVKALDSSQVASSSPISSRKSFGKFSSLETEGFCKEFTQLCHVQALTSLARGQRRYEVADLCQSGRQ